MNPRIYFPISALAVLLIGASFFGPAQPQAADDPNWIVDFVSDPIAASPVAEVAQQPAAAKADTLKGPGFIQQTQSNTCNCGDLVKRVEALERQVATYGQSRPTAVNGSAGVQSGGSAGTSPQRVMNQTVTYGSAPVVYRQVSQPVYQPVAQPQTTTVRTGLFGRRIYTQSSPSTCRIVNGQVVCN